MRTKEAIENVNFVLYNRKSRVLKKHKKLVLLDNSESKIEIKLAVYLVAVTRRIRVFLEVVDFHLKFYYS